MDLTSERSKLDKILIVLALVMLILAILMSIFIGLYFYERNKCPCTAMEYETSRKPTYASMPTSPTNAVPEPTSGVPTTSGFCLTEGCIILTARRCLYLETDTVHFIMKIFSRANLFW